MTPAATQSQNQSLCSYLRYENYLNLEIPRGSIRKPQERLSSELMDHKGKEGTAYAEPEERFLGPNVLLNRRSKVSSQEEERGTREATGSLKWLSLCLEPMQCCDLGKVRCLKKAKGPGEGRAPEYQTRFWKRLLLWTWRSRCCI